MWHPAVDAAASPEPLRVLLLENQPADVERVLAALRRGGWEPQARLAASRRELEAALDEPWDVVLSEYDLPDVDAIAAIERIRERGLDTPVLIVSGRIGEELTALYLKAGAADFLVKDRLERLPHAVRSAIGARELAREKQAAEEALARSEARSRAIVDLSLDAILIVAADGTISFASAAVEALTGWPPAAITSMPAFALVHPDDHARIAEVLGAVAADLEEGRLVTFRVGHRDGTWRTVEARGKNRIGERNVGGILMTIRDVTEKAAIEADRQRLVHDLGERVKELTLLHRVGKLLEHANDDVAALLAAVASEIPAAWQHPEIAAARITYDGVETATPGFRPTPWMQSGLFPLDAGGAVGIDVAYLAEPPAPAGKAFLAEERHVLESLGEMLSNHLDRHATAASLRESESRFRQLAETIEEVFFLYDLDTHRLLYLSAAFERISGRSRARAAADPARLLELVHPDDRERVARSALEATERPVRREYRVVRDDGTVRWIREQAFPVPDERGRVYRVAGTAQDVTDLKEAERAREQLARIVESSSDAIIGLSSNGTITSWNRGAELLYGFTADEAIGSPRSIVHPPEEVETARGLFGRALAGDPVVGIDARRRRKDGRIVEVSLTLSPIRDAAGEIVGVSSTARDVTASREAQRVLAEARDAALAASRLKSAFLANVSHEIRTPLNVILGYNALIADRMEELGDPSSKPLLDAVERGGKRLLSTIHRILDVARLETGDFLVHPESLAIAPLVARQARDYAPLAEEKGVAFEVRLEEPEARVRFDEYCLVQTVRNLLDNAVKFTEQGRVVVTLDRDPAGRLRLEIADTGVGIDAAFRPYLFEPFTQEEIGHTRHFEGTGLGLSLAKSYLERNGASLEVRSEKGRGSSFTIRFDPTRHEGFGP